MSYVYYNGYIIQSVWINVHFTLKEEVYYRKYVLEKSMDPILDQRYGFLINSYVDEKNGKKLYGNELFRNAVYQNESKLSYEINNILSMLRNDYDFDTYGIGPDDIKFHIDMYESQVVDMNKEYRFGLNQIANIKIAKLENDPDYKKLISYHKQENVLKKQINKICKHCNHVKIY